MGNMPQRIDKDKTQFILFDIVDNSCYLCIYTIHKAYFILEK